MRVTFPSSTRETSQNHAVRVPCAEKKTGATSSLWKGHAPDDQRACVWATRIAGEPFSQPLRSCEHEAERRPVDKSLWNQVEATCPFPLASRRKECWVHCAESDTLFILTRELIGEQWEHNTLGPCLERSEDIATT